MGAFLGGADDVVRETTQLLDLRVEHDDAFAEDKKRFERIVADLIRPGLASDVAARARIDHALAARDVRIVAQPIVDIERWTVAGVEALARFPGEPLRGPDAWFAEAHSVGRGVDLELLAAEMAMELLERLPSSVYLSINVGPQAIVTDRFAEMVRGSEPHRLVVELTEHIAVDDYPQLLECLRVLRLDATRLAVDDAGGGISSLAHIVKLSPDLIKLDRSLTTGIDSDAARRSLGMALVTFAKETGAQVVAEGVETRNELETLRALGITLVQGYYLARPCPLPMLHCLRATPRHWHAEAHELAESAVSLAG